jgi:hypothetical protein
MGLRDLFRAGPPDGEVTGTARVLESRAAASTDHTGVRLGDEVVANEFWYLSVGKRPHDLRLQVRLEGLAETPDVKRELKRAAAREHNASIREGLERANPDQQAMLREADAAQLPSLVRQVKNGKLKRKTFDQNMQTLVTLGQVDEALLESAKADLDSR